MPDKAEHPSDKIAIARLEERIKTLDVSDALNDLRVEVAGLAAQMRITWILLFLVLSGLVGIAFSVWRGVV